MLKLEQNKINWGMGVRVMSTLSIFVAEIQ